MGLVKRLIQEKVIGRQDSWTTRWRTIFEEAGRVSQLIKDVTGVVVDFSAFERDVFEFIGVDDREVAAIVMAKVSQAMNAYVHPHDWKMDRKKGGHLVPGGKEMKESFQIAESSSERDRFSEAAKRMREAFLLVKDRFE
jgi:hypothetical protein